MPGPWIDGKANANWLKEQRYDEGVLLEIRGYDAARKPQGEILVEVIKGGEAKDHKSRLGIRLLAASDGDLNWWMRAGPGKSLKNEGTLHLCSSEVKKCRQFKHNEDDVFHTDGIREVTMNDIITRNVLWWCCAPGKSRFEATRTRLLKEHGKDDPFIAKDEADLYELSDPDADASGTVPKGTGGKEKDAPGVGLREKMEALKGAVKAGEEEKKKKKRKKGATPAQAAVGKTDESKGRKKAKKKKRKKPPTEKDVTPTWFGEKVEAKESRDESSSSSYESETSSSRTSGKTKKKKADKKSKKKKAKAGDRGPFGVGRKVSYDGGKKSDEEETDSQSFQGGAPEKRSQQLVLMEYADRKPGRLTSRLLQKMAKLLNRSGAPFHGDPAAENKTPAVATNYYLQVLLPSLKEKANVRTQRELRTLTQVLDLLAEGKVKQGADIVSQRMKSIELSLVDQGWQRAQHLELIPLESATLADVEEQRMATKEHNNELKMRPWPMGTWKGKGAGRDREDNTQGKGKSKGKKGKKESKWSENVELDPGKAAGRLSEQLHESAEMEQVVALDEVGETDSDDGTPGEAKVKDG